VPKLKIDGREYAFPDNFTFREMNAIKRMTGLRAAELYPALAAGDTDVIVAFAFTAMRRANPAVSEDDLLDRNLDEIEVVEDEPEAEGPPADAADAPDPEAKAAA
jgi:hypothetical protein